MLNVFRCKFLPVVLSFCLLVAAIVLVGGCDQDTEQLPVYKVKGPVSISYTRTTASGGWSKSGPIKASELLMFQEYVVIKRENGASSLIPIAKIQSFDWK